MKALTLRHPWTFAIAYLGKDCENRDWTDDLAELNGIRQQIGQQIAIHGGATPQRPKRAVPLHKLAESNLWRQHCEALDAIRYGPMLGQPLPHAARQFLRDHHQGGPLTPELFILPGVVAVATVQRVTRSSNSPWAVPGALHIELSDVITLPSPVECPGMQGLWSLPPSIEQDVREELTAWSRVQVPQDSGKTAGEWLR